MKEQVEVFLKQFEKIYQKKDVGELDHFMDVFFSKDHTQLLGTSTREIYTSNDEVKKCIKNDWLYWGDLSLDYNHVKMIDNDDLVLIHVKGKVKYTFEDSSETDQRFVEFMETLNAESDETDINHLIFQQHEMTYILDHFLHRRKNEERINYMPLSLTFMVKKEDDSFKICQLSFDIETHDMYSDVVIHPYTPYEAHQKADMDLLMTKGKHVANPLDLEVSKNFFVVDVDGKIYHKQEGLRKILDRYNDIKISFDHSLIFDSKQAISFMTLGQGVLKKDHMTLRIDMKAEIDDILKSDLKDLTKLFKIRRKISLVDKMSALDQDIILPMKCVGLISKNKDAHLLEMIKFSYPMDLILEDKYV